MKKLYLDLDGVFADFDGKMDSLLGDTWRVDINEKQMWDEIRKIPHFFSHLQLMQGSLGLFHFLQLTDYGKDMEFLTACPRPEGTLATARDDKINWVRENVTWEHTVNTVVGGKNKPQFLKENPGAILIDDYKRNIKLWEEAGGIGILHRDVGTTIEKMYDRGLI